MDCVSRLCNALGTRQMPREHLLSTKQAAEYTGLSISHIQYLLREDKLEGQRVGKIWITSTEALDKYLQSNPRPGPKKKGSKP